MKKLHLLINLFVFSLLAGCAGNRVFAQLTNDATGVSSNQEIAFISVNVVPMDKERILAEQTVITKNGRIVKIGATSRTKVSPKALIIDGRGKFLMPGLTDIHVHLNDEDELLLYIANGVTTVLNMRGAPQHLQWRAEIAKGEKLGPAIYTAGNTIDGDPPLNPRNTVVTTAQKAEEVVAEQAKAGYDFIKVYSNLSPEGYNGIIAAAKRHKIRVVGHMPTAVDTERILGSGQSAVAHVEEFYYSFFKRIPDESKIPYIATVTKKNNVWVMTTIYSIENIIRQVEDLDSLLSEPEMRFVPPAILEDWKRPNNPFAGRTAAFLAKNKTMYPFLKKLTKGFQQAGVKLLTGTDSSFPASIPGFSLHLELERLVEAGLTPFQALTASTKNASEFLSKKDDFGTVAIGKRADLILVNGNPLEDITNAKRRTGVMICGRWLTEVHLRKMLDERANLYEKKTNQTK